jgi:PKD repeat protein
MFRDNLCRSTWIGKLHYLMLILKLFFYGIIVFAIESQAALVGIRYNGQQNEIRSINPDTGQSTLLKQFVFDSGSWISSTLTVDIVSKRLYVISSNNSLYRFDFTSGNFLPIISVDTKMQAVTSRSDGSLVGISYNGQQNEIRTINPDTGQSTLLKQFVFDSGSWAPDTFTVDIVSKRLYAISSNNSLYRFDLTSGNLIQPIISLDTNMQAITTGITIISNQAPVAVFTTSPTSGQAPLTVTLDGSASHDDGNITTYKWLSSDGQIANGKNTQLTFHNQGTYTITLTVTDDKGASGSAEKTITVTKNQPPQATFTISPNQGNAPLTVQLDATASTDDGNIVKYQWTASDGQTANGVKASLTFSQIGTHNITLTVTDNEAATASNTQTVTINEKPLPPPVEGVGQAIIIAAGGAEPENTLFQYSNEFTQRFYRLIKQRGFEDENIYYMNPHAPDIDLDGYLEEDKHDYKLFDPALELKEAFQQAASKLQAGQQFIFFLHGHARQDNFRIKPDYELSATYLRDLLAMLPAGVQQIIILDSCYSGSFFDKLAGVEERILISSADNNNLAWNTKSESFTDTFLRSLGRGLNLTDAFKQAEKLIIQDKQLFGNQRPWLDDDANGLYNSGDGRRAAKIQLGKEGIHAAPPPIISEVHQRQELAKDVNNATLWVRTTPDVDGILKVRATIINPQFVSQKYEGPETNFGRNELQLIYNPAQKRYEIVYEGFKTAGTWRILYQAQSKEGIWSDIVQGEVQSQGSSKIATIKVGLNLSRYKITEPLRLNLQLDGQTEADLYLAIILPDKSFITFSYPSTPSYPNEAKIYQTIKIAGPKNYTANINLPSKQGQYSTCGVLVQQAAKPLELENWIDFNCEGFEVY